MCGGEGLAYALEAGFERKSAISIIVIPDVIRDP